MTTKRKIIPLNQEKITEIPWSYKEKKKVV